MSRAELLLALSDERDLWLRRVLDAGRDGYQRGERTGYEAGWRAGFACAVDGYKAAQQEAVRDLDLHLVRWDGLRRDFGNPRPGDYTGGPVAWDGGQRS